jgi:hypothetical protein
MEIFIAVAILLAILTPIAALMTKRRQAVLNIASEDSAFEGYIDPYNMSAARAAELRPLVDAVGILSRNLYERGSRYEQADYTEAFEVFAIDINGAIHDIITLESRDSAIKVAQTLAKRLDARLDDPGQVIRGA